MNTFGGALLMAGVTAAACLGAGNAGGRIAGRVIDEAGLPVRGAIVMATLEPASAESAYSLFSASAGVQDDGTFTLVDLPLGTYKLCAEQRAAEMLNPCIWSDKPLRVDVQPSGATADAVIQMQKGIVLTIRLNDPQRILESHLNETPGAHLLIGTGHGPSPFVTAKPGLKESVGREYNLLVPENVSVDVSLYSDVFRFSDEKGVAFEKGFKISTVASKGGRKLVLNVTGAVQP